MEYRRLGHSGLMVAELCFGCMTFGWGTEDENEARTMVDRYLEAGGNFLDTADVYTDGISEEMTGRIIKGRRHEIVVATKVYFPMGQGPNDRGASRRHIIQACEASLRRLDTDFIDVYYIHAWHANTPIEETMSALSDLVHQGKVRYLAASNFAARQIVKSLWVSDANGFERFIALQPEYSLVERTIEYEVLPACIEEELGVLPWSPLAGGFLTGKYQRGEEPRAGHRLASMQAHWRKYNRDRNWETLAVVETVARESGKTPAQVALRWLLQQPGVTSPVLGARTMEQLLDNLGAIGWTLTPDQLQRLDDVSALEERYLYRRRSA